MMAKQPSGETLARQHHNLGERDTHLPRDSRNGSDSRAAKEPGRKEPAQNDPPGGTPAEDVQRRGTTSEPGITA